MVIKIEICIVRRNPLEIPTHPFLVRRQLTISSPRNSDHGHISVVQMHNYSIEIVSLKGTMQTSCFPVWIKHKVIDYQLTSSVKKFCQSLFPIRPLKEILFINCHPRQIALLLAKLIAQSSE